MTTISKKIHMTLLGFVLILSICFGMALSANAATNKKLDVKPTKTYAIYNGGSAVSPGFKVYNSNGTLLRSGTDYSYSITNNKNPGLAKISVTGKNSYTGYSGEGYFRVLPLKPTITSASAGSSNVKLTWNSIPGAKYYQAVFSTSSNFSTINYRKSITNATSYNYTGIKEGTYYVKLRAGVDAPAPTIDKANYGWSGFSDAKVVTVKAVQVKENIRIALAGTQVTYTGSKVVPSFKVTNEAGTKVLKEGTDYTVVYPSSYKPGLVKLKVTGKGNYGTAEAVYRIAPAATRITGYEGLTNTFKIDFNKVSYTEGYTIQWRKGSESYNSKNQGTIRTPSATSFTNPHTLSSGTYKVRMRTYVTAKDPSLSGSFAFSPWSNEITVTVKDVETVDYNITGGAIPGLSANESFVYRKLMAAGLSEEAAAGFVGDWYYESGIVSMSIENLADGSAEVKRLVAETDGTTFDEYKAKRFSTLFWIPEDPVNKYIGRYAGIGMAQWTTVPDETGSQESALSDYKDQRPYYLYKYATSRGMSPWSLEAQTDFAIAEFKGYGPWKYVHPELTISNINSWAATYDMKTFMQKILYSCEGVSFGTSSWVVRSRAERANEILEAVRNY